MSFLVKTQRGAEKVTSSLSARQPTGMPSDTAALWSNHGQAIVEAGASAVQIHPDRLSSWSQILKNVH